MAISSGGPGREEGPVLRYLTSNKNIAGSLAGIAGLALVFTGVISGPVWVPVVAGLYGAAALAVPNRKVAAGGGPALLDAGQIRHAINDTLSSINGKVPVDIQVAVSNIRDSVFALLGHLDTIPPGSQEGFIISRMATDYLPGTLNPYLSLPQQYANTHQLGGGKTAHDIVLEQLKLLAKTLDDVTDAVLKGDADALMANGRFLEQRFSGSELDLTDSGAAPASPGSPS